MTKSQEIARLRSLADSMGSDSYLGPWLASIAAQVEMSIRSDIIPEINISDAGKACAEMRLQTEKECAIKLSVATAQADKLVTDARNHAEYIRGRLTANVRSILRECENL